MRGSPGRFVTEVNLATPSMATVITSQCLLQERTRGTGLAASVVWPKSGSYRERGRARRGTRAERRGSRGDERAPREAWSQGYGAPAPKVWVES